MRSTNNMTSIKFYAIGEGGIGASGIYLSLDQIEKTMSNFSQVCNGQIGNAVGEMLNDTLTEQYLTGKYGSNRLNLTLDLAATICGRCIDFEKVRKQSAKKYVMGITSFRSQEPDTKELGYLAVSHGDFEANTLEYDLRTMSFPDEIWLSWLDNHSTLSLQLYHDNSKAREFLWLANELRNTPNKAMKLEMEMMEARA